MGHRLRYRLQSAPRFSGVWSRVFYSHCGPGAGDCCKHVIDRAPGALPDRSRRRAAAMDECTANRAPIRLQGAGQRTSTSSSRWHGRMAPLCRKACARARGGRGKSKRDCGTLTNLSGRLSGWPIMSAPKLDGSNLFCGVEPASPTFTTGRAIPLRLRFPPAGLVTALEPILHACNGDLGGRRGAGRRTSRRSMSTTGCRFRRTILDIRFAGFGSLRRKRKVYYYGFANEGFMAVVPYGTYTAPTFRDSDWGTTTTK